MSAGHGRADPPHAPEQPPAAPAAPAAPAPPYEPPEQGRLGQLIDAVVLLLMVFGALYAPVLLGWTSPTATAPPAAGPESWESLGQNPVMVAQWQKLGIDPAHAAPLVRSRFLYRIDPLGLLATFALLVGYYVFLLKASAREYAQVIAERFGPGSPGP